MDHHYWGTFTSTVYELTQQVWCFVNSVKESGRPKTYTKIGQLKTSFRKNEVFLSEVDVVENSEEKAAFMGKEKYKFKGKCFGCGKIGHRKKD